MNPQRSSMVRVLQVDVDSPALRDALREVLGNPGPLIMVADDNTFAAAGRPILETLRGSEFAVTPCVLSRPDRLSPDERALGELLISAPPDCGGVLAVGSGSINDLSKFLAARLGIPLVTFPTAASMDGYPSPSSALNMRGLKLSLQSAPPKALLLDKSVVAKAPLFLTQAGYGDVIAKYTALADWYLSHAVTGEPYSRSIAGSIRRVVTDAIALAKESIEAEEAVGSLALVLIKSGEAMLEWGNTRPCSGGEHQMSHYWEMLSPGGVSPLPLHGTMVGVGTVTMCELYHQIFAWDVPSLRRRMQETPPETREEFEARVRMDYGWLADEVIRVSKRFAETPDQRVRRQERILDNWNALKRWVEQRVPQPDEVEELLRQAGAPATAADLGFGGEWLERALRSAKEARQRYSVFSLLEDTGLIAVCQDDHVFIV